MPTKKALGRGLDALFGSTSAIDFSTFGDNIAPRVRNISLADIKPNPDQPRKNFCQQKLTLLAESIRNHGIIQPILVEKNVAGFYMIIAGERRWRAAKLSGLSTVPCIVLSLDEHRVMEIALLENLQREDLNAIEEAQGYKGLIEKFGYTQEKIAERVGKCRSTIANVLRLNMLPQQIKDYVINGSISGGHARAILGVENLQAQIVIANKIISDGLNVRQVETLVAAQTKIKSNVPDSTVDCNDVKSSQIYDHADLVKILSYKLAAKVDVRAKKNGGRIEITYKSPEDLIRILNCFI